MEAAQLRHGEIGLVDVITAIVTDPGVAKALKLAGLRPDLDGLRAHRGMQPRRYTRRANSVTELQANSATTGEMTLSPLLRRALNTCSKKATVSRAELLVNLLDRAVNLDPQARLALSRMNLGLRALKSAVREAFC